MEELAAAQPGYLGLETARDDLGITVSYWATEADALAWKQVGEHLAARGPGPLGLVPRVPGPGRPGGACVRLRS